MKTIVGTGVAWVSAAYLVCAVSAGARDGLPQPAPDLRAAGPAKEVPVNREATSCRIEVISGTVVINTVVVRAGRDKTPVTVARSMQAGDSAVVPFGPRRMVTGLRISDGGGGTYRVIVCDEPSPGQPPPLPPQVLPPLPPPVLPPMPPPPRP